MQWTYYHGGTCQLIHYLVCLEYFVWYESNPHSLIFSFKVKNNNGSQGIFFTADNMVVCDYALIFNTTYFRLGIEA